MDEMLTIRHVVVERLCVCSGPNNMGTGSLVCGRTDMTLGPMAPRVLALMPLYHSVL
jgi:hypothetical protein